MKKTALVIALLVAGATTLGCGSSTPGGTGGAGSTGSAGGIGGTDATTSTGGSGGTGGTGGAAGSGGTGGGGGPECTAPGDCPDPGNECIVRTCEMGACGTMNVAVDTATAAGQIAGDCKLQVCDGNGATKVIDDADPKDDLNDCTTDTCTAGANVHDPIAGTCDDNGGAVCAPPAGPKPGQCVQCNDNATCTFPQICDPVNGSNTCVDPTCADTVKDGVETDVDCGGLCAPCGNMQACTVAADCQSAFCATSVCAPCTLDGDCLTAEFCDTSANGGTCKPDKADGAACATSSQCANDACVDGVCCDGACGGTCQACTGAIKGQGLDGTCGAIVAGSDPGDECTAGAAATCGTTGVCNGASACTLFAAATVCQAPSCAAGSQQNVDLCDGTGTCVDGGTVGCGTYVCEPLGVVCLSACSDDTGCAAGNYCNSNQCIPKEGPGVACVVANTCLSGICVDNVCCDVACGGTCQACTAAIKGQGLDGACGPVVAGNDPGDECTAGAAATCGMTGACNGASACALYPAATVCQTPSCTAGLQQNVDLCNGAGACNDGGTVGCGTYVCEPLGVTCLSACSDDTGCAAGNYCSSNQCVPKAAPGAACVVSNGCLSGNCVDNVCCDLPCQGGCEACSATRKGQGADGACGVILTGTDPDNECAGVYSCNGAGACQSCGDGVAQGGEACDDGNAINGDGCESCVVAPVNLVCLNTNVVITGAGPGPNNPSILNVPTSGTIVDVNVTINATHTWPGDVTFILSHAGVTRTLIDRPGNPASTYGCAMDNFAVELDDEAATPVETVCNNVVPGINSPPPRTPNNPLSGFDGLAMQGAWNLVINDAFAGGDDGNLTKWCVRVTWQ